MARSLSSAALRISNAPGDAARSPACTSSRNRLGSMASSSTEIVAEVLRPGVGFLGRSRWQIPVVDLLFGDGNALKVISASGANSRNVSSIFSPALTPEGSKSPRW